MRTTHPLRALLPALALWSVLVVSPTRAADEEKPAAAIFPGPKGNLFCRESEKKPWHVIDKDSRLPGGHLYLGLHGTVVRAPNNAVSVQWFSDLDGKSPFPIIETAIILHEPKGVDMDFTLDRGRVIVTNTKKEGVARARVRIRDRSGELILNEPGASVAVEIYGRWLPGVPFQREPKPGYGPSLDLAVLVLKGHIDLRLEGRLIAMSAPPGPALIQWDSDTGGDLVPQKLDKLPDWGSEGTSETAQKRKQAIARLRQVILDKGLDAAIDELLASDDEVARRVGVYALGAFDQLERLRDVLTRTKHRDVWDNAVIVMRHWIGRGPGQDHKLYDILVKHYGYKPVEAAGLLQMLHGFGEHDLAQPETYEMLIDYLNHSKLGLRGMAHWYLVRLVRNGRKIAYNPLAPEAERKKAVAEWRKLVPPGKVPPKPEPEKP